jgi:hypothetical protein
MEQIFENSKPLPNANSASLDQSLNKADTVQFGGMNILPGESDVLLGDNLVSNHDFATNDFTGWTAGANWSAATGAAVHTPGSTEALTQTIAIENGKVYNITITATSTLRYAYLKIDGVNVVGIWSSGFLY